jgi:hypothetical protein
MSSEAMDGHSGPSQEASVPTASRQATPSFPSKATWASSPQSISSSPSSKYPATPVQSPQDLRTEDGQLESILKQSGKGIQTRFKDNIGWCIRTGSTETNGGRYKIMFVDGVALEVDADEEWVEFMDEGGQLSRSVFVFILSI